MYNLLEHLCGSSDMSLLTYTNYTSLPMIISPSYCISVYNPGLVPIDITYSWHTNSPANGLLLLLIILYFVILLCSSLCCCICFSAIGKGSYVLIRQYIRKYLAPKKKETKTLIQPPLPIGEEFIIPSAPPRRPPLPPIPVPAEYVHEDNPYPMLEKMP